MAFLIGEYIQQRRKNQVWLVLDRLSQLERSVNTYLKCQTGCLKDFGTQAFKMRNEERYS
jgi:hypothetical protein